MLEQDDKKRVQELFSDYLEVQDQRKQLNENMKETMDEVASILEVKKAVANKFFKFLEKKYNGEEDELDVLTELATEFEGE